MASGYRSGMLQRVTCEQARILRGDRNYIRLKAATACWLASLLHGEVKLGGPLCVERRCQRSVRQIMSIPHLQAAVREGRTRGRDERLLTQRWTASVRNIASRASMAGAHASFKTSLSTFTTLLPP